MKLDARDETLPEGQLLAVRKSHTRRQADGHVPRPRNRFMIFRSDVWASGKITEIHHGEISRMVGGLWKRVSESRKMVYDSMSKEEKKEHDRKYPGYKYAPNVKRGDTVKRRRKTVDEKLASEAQGKQLAQLLSKGTESKDSKIAAQKIGSTVATVPPSSNLNSKKRLPSKKKVIQRKASKAPLKSTSGIRVTASKKPGYHPYTRPVHKLIKKEFQEVTLEEVVEKASERTKTSARPRSISVESEDSDSSHGDDADEPKSCPTPSPSALHASSTRGFPVSYYFISNPRYS